MLSSQKNICCWKRKVSLALFGTALCVGLSASHSLAQESGSPSVDDQYRIAAGYYARSQWSDSIQAFDQLIARHPDSAQAKTALFFKGEALIQKTNYRESFACFDGFIRQNNDSPYLERAHFRRAESAFFAKPAKESIHWLESFRKDYPKSGFNEFVLAYIGQCHLNSRNGEAAIDAYSECLKRFPKSSLASKNRLGRAQSYQMAGKIDLAERAFKKLAEKDGAFQSSAMVGLGHLYFRQKEFPKAETAYRQFVGQYKNHPQQQMVAYWLARSQMAQSKWPDAISSFENLDTKKLEPNTAAAVFYDLAICKIKNGKWREASADLNVLVAEYPNSKWHDDAFAMLIEIADRNDQRDQVMLLVDAFEKAHPKSPLLNQARQVIGRIFYDEKSFAKSETIFRSLLDSKSQAETDSITRIHWRFLLAASQIGQKHFTQAVAELETIDRTQCTPDLHAEILFAEGTARVGLRQMEAAEKCFEQYLKQFPQGRQAKQVTLDLIQMFCHRKELARAKEKLTDLDSLAREPSERVAATLAVADLCFDQDQLETADENYQFVIAHATDSELQRKGWLGKFWVASKQRESKNQSLALQALMENHARSASTADAVLLVGKSKMADGKFEDAERLFEWIDQHHNGTDAAGRATIELAIGLRRQAKPASQQRATQLLLNLIADSPKFSGVDAALYELAWLHHDQDQLESAAEIFERIHNDHPKSEFRNDAMLRAATIHFDQGRYEKAIQLSRPLIAKSSKDRERADHARLIHGRAYLEQKKFAEAQEHFTYLLRSTSAEDMRTTSAHYLSDAISGSTDAEQAFGVFVKTQKGFNPDAAKLIPHVNLRVSQKLAERGNLPLAGKIAEKTENRFRDFPRQFELDYIVGRERAERALFAEARKRYSKVIADPQGGNTETAAKAQFMIGESFFHQERFAEALTEYYKVDSLFSYEGWRAAALLQAGKCQERLENLVQARKLYQQVIRIQPKSDYASQAKGRLEILNRQAKNGSNRIR